MGSSNNKSKSIDNLSPRIWIMVPLGLLAGLPLSLTHNTLQAWFTEAGLDVVSIGMLALVGQPYIYKFLWAPFLDRFSLPLLGRRRGWMFLMQWLVVGLLALTACLAPEQHAFAMGLIALGISFSSATQDIVSDAYRTDVLEPKERGLGSACFVAGYRVAMIISGGIALIMADKIGWQKTYFMMAFIMGLSSLATWFAPEPDANTPKVQTLAEAVVEPFKAFLSRPQAWGVLLFILLYKFGDAFAGALTTTFLLRAKEFSLSTVGMSNKVVGLTATIIGVFAGGVVMSRMRMYPALMLFGILQACSNVAFYILAITPANIYSMITAVFIENFCGGLGTAAFLAFLMSLCDKKYSATQFALFTALSAVGRVFCGPLAGKVVALYGWPTLYLISIAVALPGLVLLLGLKQNLSYRLESGVQLTET